MKLSLFWKCFAVAIISGVLTTTPAAAQSLTDYGAVPPIAKPNGDQSAANSKLDFHTDLLTGRFNYRVPVEVPPGRQGSEPSIALQYNSSVANGWCGVGWDLDMGYIQRETRYGVPVSSQTYSDAAGFIYSFAGQSGRLIKASNGLYYPEVNTAFLKFVYSNGYWVVTDKAGQQYTFGDTSSSRIDRTFLGTFKWGLSKIVDANGNSTTVTYQTICPYGRIDGGQLYLSQISYNANGNSPALTGNCTVQFVVESSDRSDIPSSCQSGAEICTSRRLLNILVKCNGTQVRNYALQYIVSPSTGRSLLYSVTEYGTDNSTHFPPKSFTYSALSYSFKPPVVWPVVDNFQALATRDCQLVDINGDGLPDRVTRYSGTPCSSYEYFFVQTNTGTGFGPWLNWGVVADETGNICPSPWTTIEGEFTGSSYQLSTFLDINGDGLPDRVMRGYSTLDHFGIQTNTGAGFSPVFSMSGVDTFNAYPVLNTSDGGTVSALLVDMNGDGLPDRVIEGSTATEFNVQLNQKNGTFAPIVEWSGVIGTGGYYPSSPRSRDIFHIYSELMDLNGDGLPDRVLQGGVQLNNGLVSPVISSFSTLHSWNLGSTEYPEIENLNDENYVKQLIDINGDGLPDLVSNKYNGTYSVRFNTGSGFSASSVTWTGINTNGGDHGGLTGWWSLGTYTQFIDMNGDGLPDRVIYNYPCTNGYSILVQLNNGPYPDLLVDAYNGIGGYIEVTYTNSTVFDNSDGTRQRMPFPVHVVTSVYANGNMGSATKTTYNYHYGLYDTTWREFRGFGMVDATGALGTKTTTYFHQGGGRNLSAHGEYQDSRFKAGMPYDVITYGSDGVQYKETLSQITQVQVDPNGVYFPFATNIFEFDAEPGVNCRATLKQYTYDVTANNLAASTGNLLREADLGEVNNVQYTDSYTDVSDAAVYTTYTYATLSNSSIVDKPSSITVSSDAVGNNILRKTQCQYFGATGNLQEKSEMICPTTYANTFYTYDNYGNLFTITDPMQIVTTINYDSATATFPCQKVTGSLTNSAQYDPGSGNILYATNEQGMVTANAYDPLLRLTNSAISITPNGAPTLTRNRYIYVLNGLTIGSSYLSYNYVHEFKNDPASSTGYHETYTYLDGLGRPIQVRELSETNGQYRVTGIVYDARGQIALETYPIFSSGANYTIFTGNNNCTWIAFDAIGRPCEIYPLTSTPFNSAGIWSAYPTPLTGDGGSPVGPTSLSYHDGSNPWAIVVTNALGKIHKYSLDAFGRTNQVVEVTSGGNFTTKLAYNPVGDLTNITDNALNSIAQYYNLAGQRVALADPDMGFWQYDYDLDGRLAAQTDAKLQQTRFYYNDPNGRLTRREGWTAAGACVSTNTWIYDSNGGDAGCTIYPGQLFMVTDDEGWQKFSYDARNRTLQSVRYLTKNSISYTNQFAFDDADRLTSTAYPNGGPVVTNIFDAGLHLSQVKQVGGTSFYTAKGYNELNQLNGVNFGNGAATTFGYYATTKRLKQILTTATGSTTIQSFTNRYDAVGNVIGLQDLVSSHTNAASATISSAVYDDLNRLTTATWSGYGTKTYGYNSVGNVLTNGESGVTNYVYGSIRPHAVRSANGTWFTYDQNGNAVFRGGQRLDYNVNNHLYRVINTNGVVTTFGYDANGARLWEQCSTNTLQVWIGNNYEEKNGQTLYHILANSQTVCTFDQTGTNVFEYYHPDYLTSTSLQTDKNGNQLQHYEYSAFGQTRYTQSTNVFKVSRLYTGQVLDDSTGLYYYNFRYYDPILARFMQPDDIIQDIFNPQSYNRYSYCVNNPLRFTDPSGHGLDDDDLDNIPLTMGGAHAMLRQQAGGASAKLYNQSGGELKTVATVGKMAAEANPIVGTFDSAYGAIKGNDAITGDKLTTGQRVVSGVAAAASITTVGLEAKEGASLLKGSETVERAMSKVELKATQDTGLLRGGREGTHYVSDAVNSDAKRAQQRLALKQTPEVKVTMEVPSKKFSAPTKIDPKYGMPGGGMERSASGNIPVKIKQVDEIK